MEHLYVRQSFTEKILIEPKELNANFEKTIVDKLKDTYGNHCHVNGFIYKSSIHIDSIEKGMKLGSHLHGFLTFNVHFSAKTCVPHEGIIIPCYVSKINKFGLMANYYPMDILVPRYLQDQFGDISRLKSIQPNDYVYVKAMDYKIERDRILVVGIVDRIGQAELIHCDVPTIDKSVLSETYETLSGCETYGDNHELIAKYNDIDTIKRKFKFHWDEAYQLLNQTEYLNSNDFVKFDESDINTFPISNMNYYKLWEIIQSAHIFFEYKNKAISNLILSRDPVCLTQCLINSRNQFHQNDNYLLCYTENSTVSPKEKEYSELLKKSNIEIDSQNIVSSSSFIGNKKYDIIISDITYAYDDQNIEEKYMPIYISNIISAITNQEKQGTYIMKMYDMYCESTIQLLCFLSICYDHVTIVRPASSSINNPERYVVCQGFNILNEEDIKIDQLVELINSRQTIYPTNNNQILITNIKQFNQVVMRSRIDYINRFIEYISLVNDVKSDKGLIDRVRNGHILTKTSFAKQWYNEYGQPTI